MTTSNRIRVQREDRKRLKQLKGHPRFQEICGEENPSYEDVLQEILPEPTEGKVLERPEEDMVFINLEDAYETTHELAGENESAHRVITNYLDEWLENADIDLTDSNFDNDN